MANHIIALTAGEENIYGKYLAEVGKTEAEVIAYLKGILTEQVVKEIDFRGSEKFKALSIAEKIAFLT